MDRRVDLNDKFKLSFLSVPHLLQDGPVGVPHTLQQPELAQVQLLVRALVVVVVSAALYCCIVLLLLYCHCIIVLQSPYSLARWISQKMGPMMAVMIPMPSQESQVYLPVYYCSYLYYVVLLHYCIYTYP